MNDDRPGYLKCAQVLEYFETKILEFYIEEKQVEFIDAIKDDDGT